MQVSLENLSNLKKKIVVTIPKSDITSKVDATLNNKYKKDAKIDGFRKGHIPAKVLKMHFEKSALFDVSNDVINETLPNALKDKNLVPAQRPEIDIEKDGLSEDFVYSAIFEVYPEIKDIKTTGLKVEKLVVKNFDKEVDAEIKKLQKQAASWSDGKKVKSGDKVKIDFAGTVDGKPLEGGTASDFELEIGSNSMIPGFEEGIVGLKLDEQSTLNLKFPEEYHAEHIKGKDVSFDITVKSIKTPKLADTDEEFCKKFGAEDGSLETLKTNIKGFLVKQAEDIISGKIKEQLFEQLCEKNDTDVPESLVKEQKSAIIAQEKEKYKHYYKQDIDEDNFDSSELSVVARKRVLLQLLLAEYARENKVDVTDSEVKAKIEDMAKDFPNPQMLIDWYNKDQKAYSAMQNSVLEDKLVAKLLEEAKVKEKVADYSSIIK